MELLQVVFGSAGFSPADAAHIAPAFATSTIHLFSQLDLFATVIPGTSLGRVPVLVE